ncbi:hypothetical protein MLD38_005920 [Melastoma candidum]|uniref:Uncharacterized protein n=1 Tax=Melastoma candidum TaxID=119954 RepID=A0ACB9RKZ1_9MYRT|nr:hypothetical protein MLD38_005920 [Melastoma candidum]
MDGSRPYGFVIDNNNTMQLERYHPPGQTPQPPQQQQQVRPYHCASFGGNGDLEANKGRAGVPSRSWSLGDADIQRKRRVAGYKMYGVEGKVKGSFRKSFRWLRDRYSQVVYGWR